MTMHFNTWLDTFLAEKGTNLAATFDFETAEQYHLMSYAVVIEAIKAAPAREQKAIQAMLVKIDFANASVTRYLRHLGQGMARTREQRQQGAAA